MAKQTQKMKPPTHEQRITATEEALGDGKNKSYTNVVWFLLNMADKSPSVSVYLKDNRLSECF